MVWACWWVSEWPSGFLPPGWEGRSLQLYRRGRAWAVLLSSEGEGLGVSQAWVPQGWMEK